MHGYRDVSYPLLGAEVAVDPRQHAAAYRRRLRRIRVEDFGRVLLHGRSRLVERARLAIRTRLGCRHR
jgi:hypothetical protein